MQQRLRLSHVGYVSGHTYDGVGQTCGHVHTHVRLHTEVPVVASLRLVHFRTTLTVFVHRRRRRRNQRGIDNGSPAHQQAFAGKVPVDFIEDPARQLVVLKEARELQPRGRIGRRFVRQVDTNKGADYLAVVDGIFNAFFRQAETLLGDIHA